MLLGTKKLVHKISWVIFNKTVCHINHYNDHRLPHLVIINIILLIIEGAIDNQAVGNQGSGSLSF